jgi:hypothetical protein
MAGSPFGRGGDLRIKNPALPFFLRAAESSGVHQDRACPSAFQLRPLDQTDQQKQDHRAYDSHHQLSDQSVGGKSD